MSVFAKTPGNRKEARPRMTECNTTPILFSSLARRTVEARFDGGSLTSDAGALLLREADRQLGLTAALDEAIPDPRNPHLIVHQQLTMLRQRIYGIAIGNEDLNDQQSLREDPLMQLATERGIKDDLPLASPPTLCRLENRVSRAALVDMSKVLVESFIASHATPPQELILDFDATDDPIHGEQAGRFFHGYYDSYCFLPLYVFCGDRLLVAYLRPSNIDAAQHAWAILSLLARRFRQAWPQVKIVFRGDSGFCRWKMLRWCDRHGVKYIVGLAKNSRLLKLAAPLMQQAAQQFQQSQQKQRLFADLLYAAGTWDRERRVIAKAEHSAQGENPRFVVTNLEGDGQNLYERTYCARGEMENRIKEQQLGLFADRTSCHDFLANQFRVLLSAAAYVLMEHVRRVGLAGTELAQAQVGTIRLKLLKIGARIVQSVRRVVLHLAGGYPLKQLFEQVVSRLRGGVVASG
jgi:hypothetical protein